MKTTNPLAPRIARSMGVRCAVCSADGKTFSVDVTEQDFNEEANSQEWLNCKPATNTAAYDRLQSESNGRDF